MKEFARLVMFLTLISVLPLTAQTFKFDFKEGAEGWIGDFSDYPVGDEEFFELSFSHGPLSADIDDSQGSLIVSGNNHSDDLFMFVKRKITGLQPDADYSIIFNLEIASNVPTNAVGVGGPPGEGVILKVGATQTEPQKVQVDASTDYYVMNIRKGQQAQPGMDMDTVGHVGVSDTTTVFTLIQRSNRQKPFTVRTDAMGEVWVIVGSDSGFEATTTLYYNRINLEFKRVTTDVEAPSAGAISLYPNPVRDRLIVNNQSLEQIISLSVCDVNGRQVLRQKVEREQKVLSLDVANFSAGVYCIRLLLTNGLVNTRYFVR